MKATQLYRKHNGENSVTPFNVRDKASIKLVRQQKGWGAKRICKEFPSNFYDVSFCPYKQMQYHFKQNNIGDVFYGPRCSLMFTFTVIGSCVSNGVMHLTSWLCNRIYLG